jgi:hypothetical protein
MNHDSGSQVPPRFWRSRHAVGLIVMAAVAAVFLVGEHRAHLLGALPFVLILACPLMHVFMHRGHGRHRHAPDGRRDAPPNTPVTPRDTQRGDST